MAQNSRAPAPAASALPAQHDQDHSVKDDSQPEDGGSSSPSPDGQMTSKKANDPTRPKRKKARRACQNCQRAHLTCSDSRPCERCVKRNLADQCYDGARKKAKYLHDTPNEALIPGHAAAAFTHLNGIPTNSTAGAPPPNDHGSVAPPTAFMQQTPPHAYQVCDQTQMPPPMPDHPSYSVNGSRQSPISAHFNSAQPSPMQNTMPVPAASHSGTSGNTQQPFSSQFIDQTDPSFFNFDLPSMNFGNHYGALEFGMLGHMSSGAQGDALAPGQSPSATFGTHNFDSVNYLDGAMTNDMNLGNNSAWQSASTGQGLPIQSLDQPGSLEDQMNRNGQNLPHAFAIATRAGSVSGASPSSSGQDPMTIEGATLDAPAPLKQRRQSPLEPTKSRAQAVNQPPTSLQTEPSEAISKQLKSMRSIDGQRRKRDPSAIYTTVTQPYPYTVAFHRLTAYLNKRFSARKRLRIAQALANIRPSFISLNHTLVKPDLVHMEQSFQRSVWDYEEFSSACGTPTIVCRRTGEVAHVGKEFTLLTGWTKEVLMGHQPNLNINVPQEDSAGSSVPTATSRGGFNTPKGNAESQGKTDNQDPPRQQPVFLAELLDSDSVVKFYEDYSQLAFADSKGSAWSPCKLLKYRSSNDTTSGSEGANGSSKNKSSKKKESRQQVLDGKGSIGTEEGMHKLGEKDGKVKCMYCWMVRRDTFNIPMMIVINFLPII